jgi:RNA polymerase sigma factor (sigma-70 family)
MIHHLDADESDDALVRRARSGDRDAFGELVRRHQAAALRVAAMVVGSTEEARDIVQEGFVKAYRGLDRFRGDAPVRPWLLRIVANEAKNWRRGHTRRAHREIRHAGLVAAPPPAPDELATASVDARQVLAALSSLRHDDREVLALRFVVGLTETETAEAIGAAVGTVKSRTSRALARLRDVIGTDVAR